MPEECICSKCGATLPAGAEGICPECMARWAFGLETAGLELAELNAGSSPAAPTLGDGPGAIVDRYKLLQRIGEGGFGVVYLAEQQEPVRRRVALKIIKLGMDTRQVVARFEAERQALALMDHPNIAKVLDGGASHSGRPYFVMELVTGVRITDYCNQEKLSTQERLELFMEVCGAIQHAHQKGIIHRDIKPSNILVAVQEGKAVPKVIDFGIAKAMDRPLTDKTLLTGLEQFIGTPAYVSPEQVAMSSATAGDIDTRSDIYSLGVLLYELLTGRTPFDTEQLLRAGMEEMRRKIREEDPPRPSTRLTTLGDAELVEVAKHHRVEPGKLRSLVRGDLDWIVMKALEKDRTRRYPTANALVKDIERHLSHEPVEAAAPTMGYRFQKFARRNRVGLSVAGAMAAALLLGAVLSLWQAFRADTARRQAEANRAESERHLYVADMNLAQQSIEGNNLSRALWLLERHRPREGEVDIRGWDWSFLRQQCRGDELESVRRHEAAVYGVQFSPDGTWFASCGDDGKVIVQETSSKRILAAVDSANPGHRDSSLRTSRLAISSDGTMVAVYGGFGVISLWSTTNWSRPMRTLSDSRAPMAFSGDSRLLATRCGEPTKIRVWNTRSWESEMRESDLRVLPYQSSGMAFLREIPWLLVWGEGPVRLLEVAPVTNEADRMAQAVMITDRETLGTVVSVAVHPGDHQFVTGNRQGYVNWWSLPDLRHLDRIKAASGDVMHLAFSRDGQRLVTLSPETVKLWDAVTRTNLVTYRSPESGFICVDFSPDGRRLLTGDWNGICKLWDAAVEPNRGRIRYGGSGYRGARCWLAENGAEMLTYSTNRLPELRTIERGTVVGPPRSLLTNLASFTFTSVDARTALVQADTNRLEVWDMPREQRIGVVSVTLAPSIRHTHLVSGDNRFLYVASVQEETGRLWDLASTQLLQVAQVKVGNHNHWVMAFSPDSRFLARLNTNGLELYDIRAGRTLHTLCPNQHVAAVAFSPDGRLLATGIYAEAIVWDTARGTPVTPTLAGHTATVVKMAFSPDGKTLVTHGDENVLRLWNLATGQEVSKLSEVNCFTLSSDGSTLAVWMSGWLRLIYVPPMAELDKLGIVERHIPGQPGSAPSR